MSDALTVALLGCGVVGSQVVRLLHEQADDLAARVGAPLELAGVAVRRPARHPDVPADLLTTDAAELVARDDVDLVVEVIGGIEPARTPAARRAVAAARAWSARTRRCSPRTARTLHDAAAAAGVDLYYEAAVAGAIPLLRPLRESLAGDRITRVMGIVNGTTNFILSRMDATGAGFDEALAEATALGLRRGRPDRRRRRLRRRGQGGDPGRAGLPHPGHQSPTSTARASARSPRPTWPAPQAMGCTVKLLAICERTAPADGSEHVAVRVHPAMIPRTPPARRRRRRVQRGVRRGRGGRLADVLRPRRRRRADRERGARRPRRGGPQPGQRQPRRRRERLRRPARAADGRGRDPLSRRARRRRPAGRARRGRRRVRRATA